LVAEPLREGKKKLADRSVGRSLVVRNPTFPSSFSETGHVSVDCREGGKLDYFSKRIEEREIGGPWEKSSWTLERQKEYIEKLKRDRQGSPWEVSWGGMIRSLLARKSGWKKRRRTKYS